MALHNRTDNLWSISWKDDFVQWYAWIFWRWHALRLRGQLEILTVDFEWPPTHKAGVDLVVAAEESRRDALRREKGGHKLSFRPLPSDPGIWLEWEPETKAKLLAAEHWRRSSPMGGPSFFEAPEYPTTLHACIRRLEELAKMMPCNNESPTAILRRNGEHEAADYFERHGRYMRKSLGPQGRARLIELGGKPLS